MSSQCNWELEICFHILKPARPELSYEIAGENILHPNSVRVPARPGRAENVAAICHIALPTGRARAFYTWYLSEAAVSAETRWVERRPEIARINDLPVFVTERFLREASLRMIREDPYLPTGRVPDQFRVEPGPEENTALVHLAYGDGETTLVLAFVEEMGRLLVDNVAESPAAP